MCDEETRKKIIESFSRFPFIQNDRDGGWNIVWQIDNHLQNRITSLTEKHPQRTLGDWENCLFEQWNEGDVEATRFLTVYFKRCAYFGAKNTYQFLQGFNSIAIIKDWCDIGRLYIIALQYICNGRGNTLTEINSSALSDNFTERLRNGYEPSLNTSTTPLQSYVVGIIGRGKNGIICDHIKSDINQLKTERGEHPVIYYIWYSDWRLLRDCPRKKGIEEAIRRYLPPSERFEQYSQARQVFKKHYRKDLDVPTGSPLREPTPREIQAMTEQYQAMFDQSSIAPNLFLNWLKEIIEALRNFYRDLSIGIIPPPSSISAQSEAKELVRNQALVLGNLLFRLSLLNDLDQPTQILMYLKFGFGYRQNRLAYIINRHPSQVSHPINDGIDKLYSLLITSIAEQFRRRTGNEPGLHDIEAERQQLNLTKKDLKNALSVTYEKVIFQRFDSWQRQSNSLSVDAEYLINKIYKYVVQQLSNNFSDYQHDRFEETSDFLQSKIIITIELWRNN